MDASVSYWLNFSFATAVVVAIGLALWYGVKPIIVGRIKRGDEFLDRMVKQLEESQKQFSNSLAAHDDKLAGAMAAQSDSLKQLLEERDEALATILAGRDNNLVSGLDRIHAEVIENRKAMAASEKRRAQDK